MDCKIWPHIRNYSLQFRVKIIAIEIEGLTYWCKNRLYKLDESTDMPGPRSEEIILNIVQRDKEMKSVKDIFRHKNKITMF